LTDGQLIKLCCNIAEIGKFSAPGAALISLHHAVNYGVHIVLVWKQAE